MARIWANKVGLSEPNAPATTPSGARRRTGLTRPSTPRVVAAPRAVVAGREGRGPGQQVGSPLVLTSTYAADGPVNYARNGNPTWSAFEEALGSLEGGRARDSFRSIRRQH